MLFVVLLTAFATFWSIKKDTATNFKSAMALIESAKNTPEPQIVKAPEGQDEEMELPIEALDDRSADLFEGEVKADTAEAETDEAEDETQQAVSEI